ncbi:MAG: nitroreductase family deazaflavin-dependent oxidoreductase [Anaerolineales bacterium]
MPEKVKELEPPTGLARLALRGPIWIYRFGLGKLLGNRFLELTHIGRKSGLARHTVLEVVRYEPSSGTYYIAVGFGEHSDWYKNILANPHVEVQSGSGHFKAIAVQLSPEEAGEELVKYSHQHYGLPRGRHRCRYACPGPIHAHVCLEAGRKQFHSDFD